MGRMSHYTLFDTVAACVNHSWPRPQPFVCACVVDRQQLFRGMGRKETMMRVFPIVLASLAALAATDASAQFTDLNGAYRCVQNCRAIPGQPAFVAQNGTELNLVNEAGEPSRAWIDWMGHIWAAGWNEGA